MDVQPLDFEVLDLQAPNHRPSNRQPAYRQSTDSTGAKVELASLAEDGTYSVPDEAAADEYTDAS